MPHHTKPSTGARLALIALLGFGLGLPVQAGRITSYTYNTLGLVETADGPRIDVNDVTTYEYDAQGNRTLVRDALGHETQITAYDAAGWIHLGVCLRCGQPPHRLAGRSGSS